MATFLLLVFGFYFLLLFFLWMGWQRVIHLDNRTPARRIFISVVVAMRNEKRNLERLINSFSEQSYDPHDFEVILVDDHSTDGSLQDAEKQQRQLPLTLALLEGAYGKKAALTKGILLARGDVIATTDADCVVPPHWLEKINEGFQEKGTNMLIGGVMLRNGKSAFDKLQSVEFASVIGTGLALAALRKPTMCNGANLSFRKKIFNEVDGYVGNERIASGDDEFLMRKIAAKYSESIKVLSGDPVLTTSQTSWRDFIQQRLRWASKWKSNSSLFARLLAVFIFSVQLFWLVLLPLIAFNLSAVWITLFILKILAELIFLTGVCHFLKVKFHLGAFVVLQFLYPFYVLYIGILSQVKDHEWKGRKAADYVSVRQ